MLETLYVSKIFEAFLCVGIVTKLLCILLLLVYLAFDYSVIEVFFLNFPYFIFMDMLL